VKDLASDERCPTPYDIIIQSKKYKQKGATMNQTANTVNLEMEQGLKMNDARHF
jgi:hypothetical protein